MDFFIEENKDIQHILDYLTNLYEIFDNLRHHQHIHMFSFAENTKILFPNVDPGFSDAIMEKIKGNIRIVNYDDEAIDTNIMTMLLHVYRNNKIQVKHVKIIELYAPTIDYLTYLKEKHSLVKKNNESKQDDTILSNQLLNQYAQFNHLYGNLIVNYNDNDYSKVKSSEILEFKSFLFEQMESK